MCAALLMRVVSVFAVDTTILGHKVDFKVAVLEFSHSCKIHY